MYNTMNKTNFLIHEKFMKINKKSNLSLAKGYNQARHKWKIVYERIEIPNHKLRSDLNIVISLSEQIGIESEFWYVTMLKSKEGTVGLSYSCYHVGM